MRKHLIESFDKIYIIDLHGNAKKKEVCPDGSSDQNVFDIMQGVSINIFIKTGNIVNPPEISHYDIYGKREVKYDFLNENRLNTIDWNRLQLKEPNYFFVKKEFLNESLYNSGFYLSDLFLINGAGVQTKRDNLFIDFSKSELSSRIKKLLNNSLSEFDRNELNIKNSSSYRLLEKIHVSQYQDEYLRKYNYRIFDDRYIYYDKDLLGRAFYNIMHNVTDENIGLIVCKQQSTFNFQHTFITKNLTDHNSISLQTKEASFLFPLYLYNNKIGQIDFDNLTKRQPNLNIDIVKKIEGKLGLLYTNEKNVIENTFAPIDILDYIYAVLHSPNYRVKYKEFFKIDFPRVAYPRDINTFWQLVKLGGELRQIHLLESPIVERRITAYPQTGSNLVDKTRFENGKVWINETQYFVDVPQISWDFYIGGYQPAQKWLKDRKGRELSFEDILHYQKIIVALSETDRIMKDIDKIDIE